MHDGIRNELRDVHGGNVVQARSIGEITFHLPSPEPKPLVLDALPRTGGVFVGRESELDRLLAELGPGRSDVVVIAGMAGVGKSALALAAARRAMADRSITGVLYQDPRGYALEPSKRVSAFETLEKFLWHLGVPADDISAAEDSRVDRYRSALAGLARNGHRIVLVLDNVSSAEQVIPLLPGDGSGHRVLITSRDSLTEIRAARELDLDVLTVEAAVRLLDECVSQTLAVIP